MAAQYVATFLKGEMLHLYRQICGLRQYRAVVFCQKRENPVAFPFEEVVLHRKPRTHQLRRLWQKTLLRQPITIYAGEAERLCADMQARGAQVLHVYFGHIGVHLLPLIERLQIPVVVSFHGADAGVDHGRPSFARALRQVFSLSTLILVRSESIATELEKAGCPREKIRLHRTGLPLEEIAFKQRQPPADGAWRVVQASRLIAKKGLPTTLRAFQQFQRVFPSATLTLAGEGPLREELQRWAAEHLQPGSVHFPGFLSQAALQELLAVSHLFVHPSQLGEDGDQEGVPNSMLEAMASGLPVCATRHGGIPEAVEDGVSGLLVAERDAEGLAGAMLALAQAPAQYQAMSLAASQRARQQFDLAAQTRVLEGVYDEALTRLPSR